MRCVLVVLLFSAGIVLANPGDGGTTASPSPATTAYRLPPENGWTKVHLEGSPRDIGFQNGSLLATEIDDLMQVIQLELKHDSKKEYSFFIDAAKSVLWPHIEEEYREELRGIADGLHSRGSKLELWDVVVLNAANELSYYNTIYNKEHGIKDTPVAPEHCSAFVATGSYTQDGKVVIAHNDWTNYLDGARANIIFDIVPAKGHRILMDGLPGWIHSGDDFGMNAAGIAITETTIFQFEGFDRNGIPEFVRARKAMQYSESIDDFARLMTTGNNGGYANTWLVADANTNEIAELSLGLKNVDLHRTKDGYFVGSNFPATEKLAREETKFNLKDPTLSPNARRIRAEQLVHEGKGDIDVAFAKRYLSDHFDSFDKKEQPNERTLCGHIDLSPRGVEDWQPKFGTAGTVQNKAADGNMVLRMQMTGAIGHSCGLVFLAKQHLNEHPEFAWEEPLLRDLPSFPWTEFSAGAAKTSTQKTVPTKANAPKPGGSDQGRGAESN